MKETSTKEFAEMICESILEDKFFDKEKIISKIRSLSKIFRLKLASVNYNKIPTATEYAKMIRSNEIMNEDKLFWVNKLRAMVDEETMNKFFKERDIMREKYFLNDNLNEQPNP